MKGINTRFESHDSNLRAAQWQGNKELRLSFELDTNWNEDPPANVSLVICGVRNRPAVDVALHTIALKITHDCYPADAVAFLRASTSSYLLDTSQGALVSDAPSFAETDWQQEQCWTPCGALGGYQDCD